MTAAPTPDTLEWVKDVGLPVVGFVAGFLTSRWTLTKKDRKDLEQKNFENTSKLLEDQETTYVEYTSALAAYADAPSADAADFVEIASKGDRYFLKLNMLASAILSDKVDAEAREQMLVPHIRSAVTRMLPNHYDTLKEIADRYGFAYRGELRRTDHGAIYDVVEKYGAGPEWSRTPRDAPG